MRFALVAALVALGGSSIASAEPVATTPAAQASKATAKKTRKVCRREDTTGSTIPKRICRTVEVTNERADAKGDGPVAGATGMGSSANR